MKNSDKDLWSIEGRENTAALRPIKSFSDNTERRLASKVDGLHCLQLHNQHMGSKQYQFELSAGRKYDLIAITNRSNAMSPMSGVSQVESIAYSERTGAVEKEED